MTQHNHPITRRIKRLGLVAGSVGLLLVLGLIVPQVAPSAIAGSPTNAPGSSQGYAHGDVLPPLPAPDPSFRPSAPLAAEVLEGALLSARETSSEEIFSEGTGAHPFVLRAVADRYAPPRPAPHSAEIAAELKCLAQNIYFEARGEDDAGKLAVAHVVLNRAADRRFPDTICGVVRQGGEWPHGRCQFSWWCDGRSDNPKDGKSWAQAQALARKVFWGFTADPTRGALWYHADYVSPSWRHAFTETTKIGRHVFYTDSEDIQTASAE